MSTSDRAPHALPTLYNEHLALGAAFGEGALVSGYASTAQIGTQDLLDAAFLCDLSHVQTLLFSGAPAPAFAHAAFAGKELAVGSCAFEAVLTGDGSVASVPLLARTGTHEYAVFDLSARREVLSAWLSFLAAVEQDGYAPYRGMATDEVSGAHVALLLGGAKAPAVLGDYLGAQRLPGAGEVASRDLDAIPCIVAGLPLSPTGTHATPCYLVLVPPTRAVALWRSLLSFGEVSPIGSSQLERLASRALPWAEALVATDALRLGGARLSSWGLVREGTDFVGARGLAS